jgi:hypothetical protein
MKFDKIVLILYLILILFVFLIFLYEKNTLYKSSTILFSLMILLIDPIIRTGRPWGIDSYTFLAQISGFLNQTFPLDYVLVVPQTQYMIIGFFLYTISFSSILEFGMIVLPIVNCSIFIIYFLRLKEELPFNIKIFLLLLIFSPLLLQIQRINSAQTIGLFFFIVSIYFEKYQDKVTKNWSFLFGICTSIHNLTALIYLSYLLIKPVFEEKNTYPKQFFLFNSITIVIILFILEITQFFTVVLNPTILTNNIFYDLLDGPVLYYSPVYAVIKIKLRILLIFILIFSFIFSLFLNQHKGYHIQKISRNKWFQTIKMTYNKNITNIQTLINERIYLTTILLSLTIVSTSFFILIYVLNYKFGMSVFYVFIFYLNYLSVLLLLIYFILKKEIRFDFFIIVISIIIPFFMFLFGSNTLKWFSSLFIRPIYLVIASTIFAIPFEFKKELFYKKNSKKTPIFTFLSISLGFLGSFLFAA